MSQSGRARAQIGISTSTKQSGFNLGIHASETNRVPLVLGLFRSPLLKCFKVTMSPASSQQVAVHTSQNGVGFTLPLTRVRRVHEDHRGKGQRGLPTVSGRGLHAVKEQLRNADS